MSADVEAGANAREPVTPAATANRGRRISHLLISVSFDVFDSEGRKCNIQDTGNTPLIMCEAEIPPSLYDWLRSKRLPV